MKNFETKISSETLSMLETALRSTIGWDENNKDFMLDSKYSVSDIPFEFQVKAQNMLNEFLLKATDFLTQEELDTAHIGHDFWLTLHGHGAGFWDGDYEQGEKLTEICKSFEELEDELRDILPGEA